MAETKKQRDLLVGIHAVAAVVEQKPERLRRAWVAKESRNRRVRELEEGLRNQGVAVENPAREFLDRLVPGTRHQDVVAELEGSAVLHEKELDSRLDAIEGDPLLLVLDGVQDPHNLGACLRSAAAAGVDLVIMTRDRSAGLTPVARRAAAGAAEIVPLLAATNLARVLRRLKERGIWLYGAAGEADTSLWDAELSGPVALVMGAEAEGLRRLTRESCDALIRIPMTPKIESLNVSVATGVCLFEIARQRSGS